MGLRLSDEEAWARIAAAPTGILTTLRRDGQPIALPVWHAVIDRRIYVQTPRGAKKVARVSHDERASFLVESGLDWAELSGVVLPVTAAVVTDAVEAADAIAAVHTKYAAHIPAPEQLPGRARAAYADMAVIRLDPAGTFLTWDNAALVGRA